MKKLEMIQRDIARESGEVLYYKGYVFPKYIGRLTNDELNSRRTFYAFWGNRYLPAMAIRYHVDQLLQRGVLPEAA